MRLKSSVVPQVVQKTKSFPFGTAVNAWKYNANAAGGKYRDFIHQHFNWAVPEASLKWPIIERQRVSRIHSPEPRITPPPPHPGPPKHTPRITPPPHPPTHHHATPPSPPQSPIW